MVDPKLPLDPEMVEKLYFKPFNSQNLKSNTWYIRLLDRNETVAPSVSYKRVARSSVVSSTDISPSDPGLS